MSFALIQVERGSLHECAFLALRMRTASYEAKFWDGLSVIFGFLCYNLIRGAWTDASGRRFAFGIDKGYFLTVSCR